jgi:zinc protease
VIARSIRIALAYSVLGLTTALLVATASATAGAQAAGTTQQRAWPTERPPRPLEARPVKFPPYEIKKMANGLPVVIVSQNEQPVVSVRMIVRAGAAHDPKGKMGVAMMTATLLDQGAGGRSAAQIADSIDFVGGILGTGAGTDLTYVNTVVLKDTLDVGLQLMADVVRRPTFAPEEINRQKQQAMSGLQVSAEDPDTLASQVIDRLIYGFHPYGLPGSGTAESLSGISRQDLVDFHRTYYVPNNALVAVVGDITAAEAMAGLEKAFADWKPGDVPAFKPIEQAGRGADRDSRRPDWDSAPAQRLPRDGSGGEDPRRRGREPAAAGAALAARSHLRRFGRPRNLQGDRRDRCRNRYAYRGHRRSAAAGGR